MTDIVERLKAGNDVLIGAGLSNLAKSCGLSDAAAEITALREKLEGAERERDEAHKRMQIIIERERSTIDGACSLQARVERLEKALRFYAERMTYTSRTGMECGITKDHFGDRARAALAADGDNNDKPFGEGVQQNESTSCSSMSIYSYRSLCMAG